MIEKIKELRTMLPIPMVEAKELLTNNDGDIETCVLLYVAKAIGIITEATGASKEVADRNYRAANFDINRAILNIKDEIYDANYQPIEGVTKESLQITKDWVYNLESSDLGASLSYIHLQEAINTMLLIPDLLKVGQLLQEIKTAYDRIFQGYDDSLPLEDFITRNRQLDEVQAFQVGNQLIPASILNIKNELEKHWRNVIKNKEIESKR